MGCPHIKSRLLNYINLNKACTANHCALSHSSKAERHRTQDRLLEVVLHSTDGLRFHGTAHHHEDGGFLKSKMLFVSVIICVVHEEEKKERSRELFLRDELLGRQVFPNVRPAKFQFPRLTHGFCL